MLPDSTMHTSYISLTVLLTITNLDFLSRASRSPQQTHQTGTSTRAGTPAVPAVQYSGYNPRPATVACQRARFTITPAVRYANTKLNRPVTICSKRSGSGARSRDRCCPCDRATAAACIPRHRNLSRLPPADLCCAAGLGLTPAR